MRLTRLYAPRKLGSSDHWHVQLAGQQLEATRYFADFLHPVAVAAAAASPLHQLQIVYNDHVHTSRGLQAAGFGAQFGGGEARGVVNVDWSKGKVAKGTGESLPLVVGQVAVADAMRLYPSLHR